MAKKLAEFEVQTALYSRLNGALSYPIYDDVPDNAKYPYLEIGDPIANDASLKGSNLQIVTVSFHAWDRSSSNKANATLMNEVLALVTVSGDSSPSFLSLTNFTVVNQFHKDNITIKDIDGETRHMITTVEFWCQQN